MSSAIDTAAAARRLAGIWKDGGARIAGLPVAEKPRSADEAYAIQAELRRQMGEPLSGYKLGLSSPAGMRASGLGRPARGFMTIPRTFASGDRVAGPPDGRIMFELEVCFRVGRAVRPGADAGEILSAMSSAHLGMELVSSRLIERLGDGLPSFLADDIGFHAYVVGAEIERALWIELFAAEASIEYEGSRVAVNLEGDARTQPIQVLTMFAEDAAVAGWPIEPGMLITTGTLVSAHESPEQGRYVGRLAGYEVACEVI